MNKEENIADELKKATDDIQGAIDEIRKRVDKGASKEEVQNLLKKHEEKLDKQEELATEVGKKLEAIEETKKELNDKIEAMDKKLTGLTTGTKSIEKSKEADETKAFLTYLQGVASGAKSMGDAEVEYKSKLNEIHKSGYATTSPSTGGVLVPEILADMLATDKRETTQVRNFAKVTRANVKTITIPLRTTNSAPSFIAEGDAVTESENSFDVTTLTAYRASYATRATKEQIEYANNDFVADMFAEVREGFEWGLGNLFWSGNGANQAEGILVNADVVKNLTTSANAGAIDMDELIRLTGAIKGAYNPKYFFNRTTKAEFLTLKGTNGHYLWNASRTGFNELNGNDYIIDNALPDIKTGTIPVVFGDIKKGYHILESTALTMIIDPYTEASRNTIKYTFNTNVGGKVVCPEAFTGIKVK